MVQRKMLIFFAFIVIGALCISVGCDTESNDSDANQKEGDDKDGKTVDETDSGENITILKALGCDSNSSELELGNDFEYEKSTSQGEYCIAWKLRDDNWLLMDIVNFEFGCYYAWTASLRKQEGNVYEVILDQDDYPEPEEECGWPGCSCYHNWSISFRVEDVEESIDVRIVINDCGAIDPAVETIEIKSSEIEEGIKCY